MNGPEQTLEINDHKLNLPDLYQRYNTDPEAGLTDAKAKEIFNRDGPNMLPQPKTTPEWMKICRKIFGGFALLFWICASLCFIVHALTTATHHENVSISYLWLGIVLIIVVIVTGFFSYYQESKISPILNQISDMIPEKAVAIRNGEKQIINAKDLDLSGTAKGLVIRTGDHTVIGRTINSISNQSTGDTSLTKEISHLNYSITRVAVILGISFFIITLSFGYPFIESIILLIVIIIANVPTGLSITITICLTLIAERMARKNLDVSENQALSTFDKNSRGFLALSRCATLCNRADFKQDSENLAQPVLQRACNGDSSEVALLKCVELSTGNVSRSREIHPKVCEIPFNSTNKYQLSIHELNTNIESEENSRSYLLVMKGAPEGIIERCSTIYIDGEDLEMNDYWRTAFEHAYLELGKLGERVLGFCDLCLPGKEYPYGYSFDTDEVNFPTTNLRFLGLMGMIDASKASVPDVIMKCRSAGIKVIMVTGDHPITSKAIARTVGIISKGSETAEDIAERLDISLELVDSNDAKACVIHGNDLRAKSPEEIDALLRDYPEIVFARTSPQQKAIIVEACQRQGDIVTMIGNSVHDLPALQQADVGIVIGIIQVATGLFAYFLIMIENGFSPSHLFDLRKSWESKDVNNSYGQEWTNEQRKQLKFTCYTAFVITIIICQWATLIIFKTRRDSILQQNMNNLMLNVGMIFETILLAIISYIIYSNTALNTYSSKFGCWLPALSYVILILILDEVRKYIIRKHPGGVVDKETSY
ncbi:unnamed protein product [Rotaria sordida]|uniref:Cation-transporting P-type ATPase N-terminal domain-containing protein n=1 Tax=Rotaria sordida TaxID=392033 RepID=A0A815MRJ1_9BILA|nr:unnamed protein product [Rotaria sordida]